MFWFCLKDKANARESAAKYAQDALELSDLNFLILD